MLNCFLVGTMLFITNPDGNAFHPTEIIKQGNYLRISGNRKSLVNLDLPEKYIKMSAEEILQECYYNASQK